jgi:hypothetical protein
VSGALKRKGESVKRANLYSQCPKAIQLESLSKLIEDDSGNRVELCQLLADDKAVDLTARLDAKLTLESYPKRFVDLAYKKYAGYPLDKNEQNYYYREQRKAKKALIR